MRYCYCEAEVRQILDTGMRCCYCEAEVRSPSVSVVYVVCLRIVFSKPALSKEGFQRTHAWNPLWIRHCTLVCNFDHIKLQMCYSLSAFVAFHTAIGLIQI